MTKSDFVAVMDKCKKECQEFASNLILKIHNGEVKSGQTVSIPRLGITVVSSLSDYYKNMGYNVVQVHCSTIVDEQDLTTLPEDSFVILCEPNRLPRTVESKIEQILDEKGCEYLALVHEVH